MEESKSIVHVAEENDKIEPNIPQSKNSAVSEVQNEDCPVETREDSYQARARSGSPKNGVQTIPLLLEGQVSDQARARSGSPKNGDPTIPLLLEGQVCDQARARSGSPKNGEVYLSAERSLGCNEGSASTTGILGRDGSVKPTRDALLATLCKPKCSWGLIWRKKKPDLNTGEDFVSRKVILNGNPDMRPIKPTCHYCSQPYDSNLMYIQCETCPSWYHADAVGLIEKKISDLVGFKCCKCRKIRKPACPYAVPDSGRIPEVKKVKVDSIKVENIAVAPCPGSVQEQQDLLPNSVDETPHAAHDDPLPVSSSQIWTQSENNTQMDYEANTANISAPQKLPVRRSAEREKDEDLITGDG